MDLFDDLPEPTQTSGEFIRINRQFVMRGKAPVPSTDNGNGTAESARFYAETRCFERGDSFPVTPTRLTLINQSINQKLIFCVLVLLLEYLYCVLVLLLEYLYCVFARCSQCFQSKKWDNDPLLILRFKFMCCSSTKTKLRSDSWRNVKRIRDYIT